MKRNKRKVAKPQRKGIERPQSRAKGFSVASFAKKYPGGSKELMDVLTQFLDHDEDLKPALPNLAECIKNAIFWHKIENVHVLRKSEADLLGEQFFDLLDVLAPKSLFDLLYDLLDVSLGHELRSSPDSRSASIFAPLAFIQAGQPEEAEKFRPLLELMIAGNLPIGSDKEGNFFVLVAD